MCLLLCFISSVLVLRYQIQHIAPLYHYKDTRSKVDCLLYSVHSRDNIPLPPSTREDVSREGVVNDLDVDASRTEVLYAPYPAPDPSFFCRRLSAVPNRTRYSVGVSRYSLPPNMPPNASPTKSEQGDVAKSEFLWQHRVGDVWEGLKLKFPLTRDEKKLVGPAFRCDYFVRILNKYHHHQCA